MSVRMIVIGTGPIGGIIGGRLARAGNDMTFVDVDQEHVAAIREAGLQVDVPDGPFNVRIPIVFLTRSKASSISVSSQSARTTRRMRWRQSCPIWQTTACSYPSKTESTLPCSKKTLDPTGPSASRFVWVPLGRLPAT